MLEPLVFLPGLQSDHRSWVNQLNHFDGKRETMVPHGYHHQASLQAMAAMIEPQLPERFHLIAWSMGGYLAFEMLPQIAERLCSLILVSTSARADSPESATRRHQQIELAETCGMRAANRQSLSLSCVDQSLLQTEAFVAANDAAEELGVAAYKAQQSAIMQRCSSLDRLSLVRCPTLVIVGEKDVITPLAEARAIHSGVAGSKLEILADCGHCSPLEKPDQVNIFIEDWVRQAERL